MNRSWIPIHAVITAILSPVTGVWFALLFPNQWWTLPGALALGIAVVMLGFLHFLYLLNKEKL